VNYGPRSNFLYIAIPFTIYIPAYYYLLPLDTLNPLFTANRWDWQPHRKLGAKYLVLLCAGSTRFTKHLDIHRIIISWTTHLGSPPRYPRGGILIHTLSSFTIRFKFSLITKFITKSSLIMEMTFRKDLILQGYTTLPTHAYRLFMLYDTRFTWHAGKGWSTKTFPLLSLVHESLLKGLIRHREMDTSKWSLFAMCGIRFEAVPLLIPATPTCMPCTLFTNVFCAYAEWKSQTMWLMDHTR
jgi:hypothetical protein